MNDNPRTATPAQLGTIALGTDGHTRRLTSKLDSVGDDADQRFYMLATFCFDLSRKLKYITLALQEFYRDAPPEMAKKIRDHERYINPSPEIPWEEMARRAQQVMNELYAEVQASGYPGALDELADRAEPQAP